MRVSLIAAVAQNADIGRDNHLPWRLPEHLQYFKRVTMGKPIIMGRKTFESIGRPLPGRSNIVISRRNVEPVDGLHWVDSPERAVAVARNLGADEAMVIGGELVYRALLPMASRLYLTEVQAVLEGDAFFPHYDPREWVEVRRQAGVQHKPGINNKQSSHDFSFVVLERCAHPLSSSMATN